MVAWARVPGKAGPRALARGPAAPRVVNGVRRYLAITNLLVSVTPPDRKR
jgi:hypothetical protein